MEIHNNNVQYIIRDTCNTTHCIEIHAKIYDTIVVLLFLKSVQKSKIMGYNCNFEREGREASRRCSRPSLLTDMVCVSVATQAYVVATSRFLDHHGHVVASDLPQLILLIEEEKKWV